MKVINISVSAGRTFNHPYEEYSNLRPSITLDASIEDGEDFEAAVRALQEKAESIIEDYKAKTLGCLERLQRAKEISGELERYEAAVRQAQDRLNRIKEEARLLQVMPSSETEKS